MTEEGAVAFEKCPQVQVILRGNNIKLPMNQLSYIQPIGKKLLQVEMFYFVKTVLDYDLLSIAYNR